MLFLDDRGDFLIMTTLTENQEPTIFVIPVQFIKASQIGNSGLT